MAEVVFREGYRIIPLARCGHLIRYPLEWSLYFLVRIRLLLKKNPIYVPLREASGRDLPCIKENERDRYCITRTGDECH